MADGSPPYTTTDVRRYVVIATESVNQRCAQDCAILVTYDDVARVLKAEVSHFHFNCHVLLAQYLFQVYANHISIDDTGITQIIKFEAAAAETLQA